VGLVALAFGLGATSGTTPPDTFIDAGPSGTTHDPTPTFSFHSDQPSVFQCKVDAATFVRCTSPRTLAHLGDGSHTFTVRARNSAGLDPTPATRTFDVATASVAVTSGELRVIAADGASGGPGGAKDNLVLSRPSASTFRVTDLPSGPYTGSGIHVGAGCRRVGDYTADCSAQGVRQAYFSSGSLNDRMRNATILESRLYGGYGADTIIGGRGNDHIHGSFGRDAMKGMNGDDFLAAHENEDDRLIDCDGGTVPGTADRADLDLLPKDSPATGCESVKRY
jgi:hemolysin type calcium-binding protein